MTAIANQAEASVNRRLLAVFDLRQKPRTKMLGFSSRFLVLLVVWSAAIVLVPTRARSQGATATPVTLAPATNPVTAGGELEKVTVTGYLIPRVGGGPQPVFTLDQDFISKQADQTINDVLNRYPGGLSQSNALTQTGVSTSPASSAF